MPCTTAFADVPVRRPSLPRRNWQSVLQTWRTRCSHVLLFAVKRVVDPSHGPIRGPREIAWAILKAIPTQNRKAIAAQLFLVSGSQNQVGSSISMARTKKMASSSKKWCYVGLQVLNGTRCATWLEYGDSISLLTMLSRTTQVVPKSGTNNVPHPQIMGPRVPRGPTWRSMWKNAA